MDWFSLLEREDCVESEDSKSKQLVNEIPGRCVHSSVKRAFLKFVCISVCAGTRTYVCV